MAWSYKNFEESDKTKKYYDESEAAQQAISDLGDFKYNTYTESDKIKGLQANLDAHNAGKPTDWMGGTHGATVQDFMDQINNREKFSYDLNGDALYQQYKGQFVTQGKLAMMDTMGQAAAMTGGYGNSYAQNIGQQAYQGYLQQLNDKVPELYQLALDKYNMEGEQLLNKYGIALDAYNREYGEHRDAVSDWESQRAYLTDQLNNERSWEYGLFSDGEDRRFNEYNLAYNKLQDTLNRADNNYWNSRGQDYTEYSNDRNFDYNQNQDGIANSLKQKEYELALDKFNADIAASGLVKGEDGSYTVSDGFVGNPTGSIPDSIKTRLGSFSNNSDIESYLDDLTDNGIITEVQADQLYVEYKDHNEKSTLAEMVTSTDGWSVVNDGGINWFGVGIDANAILKAPNGQQYRLDNLRDALVSEGMKKGDATNLIKKLQKNLGI